MVLAGPSEIWGLHHATGTMSPGQDGGLQDIIQVMVAVIPATIPVMVAVVPGTIQVMAVAVDIIQAAVAAVILAIIQVAVAAVILAIIQVAVAAILVIIQAQHLLGATILVVAAAAVIAVIIQAVAAVIPAIILVVEVTPATTQAPHQLGATTQVEGHPRKLLEEDGCTQRPVQLFLQQPDVHHQTITGPAMEVEAMGEVEVLADQASGDNDQCFQISS